MVEIRESILCSAVWYLDLPTPIYRPDNIDQGIVFCGRNHIFCIHQMIAMTGKKQYEAGKEIQGFLTNLNRFVDRKEAILIAKKSGQLPMNSTINQLHSEDIF
jgi:hypothetical protein